MPGETVRTWLRAVVLALLTAASVGAAEPSLEVTVPDGAVAVGDRVPVRVQARGEAGLWGELTVRVNPDGPWAVVDGPREIEGSRPPAWEVILVPLKVERLLLAGRCISATHEASGCIRPTAQCMVTGEAAGAAAWLCVERTESPRRLDVAALRKVLADAGAVL